MDDKYDNEAVDGERIEHRIFLKQTIFNFLINTEFQFDIENKLERSTGGACITASEASITSVVSYQVGGLGLL